MNVASATQGYNQPQQQGYNQQQPVQQPQQQSYAGNGGGGDNYQQGGYQQQGQQQPYNQQGGPHYLSACMCFKNCSLRLNVKERHENLIFVKSEAGSVVCF